MAQPNFERLVAFRDLPQVVEQIHREAKADGMTASTWLRRLVRDRLRERAEPDPGGGDD